MRAQDLAAPFPTLARVIDEAAAPDATVLESAAIMARVRSPLAAVAGLVAGGEAA